jgi:hypothetical protein
MPRRDAVLTVFPRCWTIRGMPDTVCSKSRGPSCYRVGNRTMVQERKTWRVAASAQGWPMHGHSGHPRLRRHRKPVPPRVVPRLREDTCD